MASDEADRVRRAVLRRLRLDGRWAPQYYAEWVVEAEHRWWSEVRPGFVLDHLRQPWTVPLPERPCPMPEDCDTHYENVQTHIWRIGWVLPYFSLLSGFQHALEFPDFAPQHRRFLEVWIDSAEELDDCWLPDEQIPAWLEAFGGHPPSTITTERSEP
jgi:hypothetical protein